MEPNPDPHLNAAPLPSPPEATATRPRRKWLGPAAAWTLAVFLVGRLAVEPLRSVPQFDNRGMEAFGAVERYVLKPAKQDLRSAVFGTSVSMWAVIPSVLAPDLGMPPECVVNVATAGGTPFDMRNMFVRNTDKFQSLEFAILEINPFVFRETLEHDPRIRHAISNQATLRERFLLTYPGERWKQAAEWVLPIQSVRRSLRSCALSLIDPEPDSVLYPNPDIRAHPAPDWNADRATVERKTRRQLESADVVARRLVRHWKVSALQAEAMRKLIGMLRERHVHILLQQPPIHPEVAAKIKADPELQRGYAAYLAFVECLGVPEETILRTLDVSECGASEAVMSDRLHLNEEGAKIYSAYLGKWARRALGSGTSTVPEAPEK